MSPRSNNHNTLNSAISNIFEDELGRHSLLSVSSSSPSSPLPSFSQQIQQKEFGTHGKKRSIINTTSSADNQEFEHTKKFYNDTNLSKFEYFNDKASLNDAVYLNDSGLVVKNKKLFDNWENKLEEWSDDLHKSWKIHQDARLMDVEHNFQNFCTLLDTNEAYNGNSNNTNSTIQRTSVPSKSSSKPSYRYDSISSAGTSYNSIDMQKRKQKYYSNNSRSSSSSGNEKHDFHANATSQLIDLPINNTNDNIKLPTKHNKIIAYPNPNSSANLPATKSSITDIRSNLNPSLKFVQMYNTKKTKNSNLTDLNPERSSFMNVLGITSTKTTKKKKGARKAKEKSIKEESKNASHTAFQKNNKDNNHGGVIRHFSAFSHNVTPLTYDPSPYKPVQKITDGGICNDGKYDQHKRKYHEQQGEYSFDSTGAESSNDDIDSIIEFYR
ncbi:uncharacterized protein SCODWIG_02097 [Saccharomycodes ludwigii]|uniref:Uncharacterized protein n=1 Tax=Saccharomycodes ludwigii TaxID=36035 RepID=A0A376B6L7_9ASCO|nr:hypothetical protein SCDLUD_000102 [Saccharomycodes ludwigii]KAH3902524.1 hypothetical protein SCDLUD_000102 [Saccharomycodes ludwigii]SSD60336.1 uncharacterized protein SCODWIG_02097 [Saccharomycodes ludwigii]